MHKILLIEDEAQHIILVKIRLELKGYQVAAAQTAADGIAAAAAQKPDLILLDLLLPDMGTADIIKALRALPANGKTPIIAFTALDAYEIERRNLGAEIADYIQKPYETSELFEKVGKYLKDPPPER
ncbi:MAG TPA: response regulator [Elusimicrobiales bacterium]|nr:response regulator [Elusimicrobiales bacterium]